jgi:Calx-beta domain
VLIAGGSHLSIYSNSAFVTRLVGGDDKDSRGVIGVLSTGIEASEDGQQAIVTVRRVGGKTGSVSVAYATRAGSSDAFHATEGDDFTALTDRLTWADGDAADKQFSVPIAPDDGAPEEREAFDVELSDVQGGAGLGTSITSVSIASDATDAGMFAIESEGLQVNELDRTAQVLISRNYSWSGAVTVTVTLASDTATAGDDFAADPLTVSWADGDSELKLVDIPIVNDSARESSERFTLQLSDPTGGAVVGPRSTVSVTVSDDDAAPPTGGGGGLIGIGSLLWLGILRWLRVSRDRRRSKPRLAPG